MRIGENKNIKVTSKRKENGVEIVGIKIDLKGTEDNIIFKIYSENRNSYSILSSLCLNRFVVPSWKSDLKFYSRANQDMPVVEFIDKQGQNICFFALTNCSIPLKIQSGIEERTGDIEIILEIQKRELPNCEVLETEIYLDKTAIPYYEAIAKYNEFLNIDCKDIPIDARKRTYSTWYSYQRNIDAGTLTKQFLMAKEYGMNNVIIDDGWQTEIVDTNTGQAYIKCGDWDSYKGKFTNFETFIDNLHKNGIKVMLWFGTPFIGRESKYFKQFEGKYLKKVIGEDLMMPDPRYKEVRDWYVSLFENKLIQFNIDGFKLDFIDDFELSSESVECDEKMDVPCLGQAVSLLVKEITDKLRSIKKDLLIEFRQRYIGPLMQNCCNIIRVQDCAYGAFYNRINGITLRLFCPHNSIQSDMLMWDYNASPEAVGDQLAACLFITPQISMKLEELSSAHKAVLKTYLDFIDDNMDVLQFGKLIPLHPEVYYPVCYSIKDNKLISVLYDSNSFKVEDNIDDFVLINASGNENIYLDLNNKLMDKTYKIIDCQGRTIKKGVISNKLDSFVIPHCGFLFINH